MLNIYTLIFIYIIFHIQSIKTYELNKILSKDEVLKITDNCYLSFYCKNDTCVSTYYDYRNPYIEIPDENNNLIEYITDTCRYNEIKLNKCNSKKCTADSECLSNKCVNNYCVFNEETPIVYCESVYNSYGSTFIHCGKPYNDICEFNNECSSKICSSNKICSMNNRIFSKRDVSTGDIIGIYIVLIIIFIIIPISCCCCYCIFPKYRKYITI